MKYTFPNKVEFEGKQYADINLDLESLTGADMSAVKREWTAAGNFSALVSTDMDFCACVAAKAAKLPLEFFTALPAKEYIKITQTVSNFLLV